MITSSQLQNMKDVKISEVNKKELVDINTVSIDTDEPITERIEKFLEQIKNPYCFLCNDITVKIEFDSQGKSLDEILKKYLTELKNR